MAIERSESQQTTCNATAVIDGERRQVASATCSIRPGKNMTISVDVQGDMSLLSDEDRRAIALMFEDYLAEEQIKASELGIPILPENLGE